MPYQKIFFSYSRVDGEKFALKLAADLRDVGANVWIDQIDIPAGSLWDQEIEKTLQTSDCLLFIATAKSTTSNNVLNEVYYALEENKHVIPVIFDNCKIPFRLKRLQHIDFTVDYDRAFNRLLEALGFVNQPGVSPGDMVKREERLREEREREERQRQERQIEERQKEEQRRREEDRQREEQRRREEDRQREEQRKREEDRQREEQRRREEDRQRVGGFTEFGPQQMQVQPKNWLVESILVTLFCCLPFGIAAIISASQVSSKWAIRDYAGAQKASQNAAKWTKIGLFSGIALWVLYFIAMFAFGLMNTATYY